MYDVLDICFATYTDWKIVPLDLGMFCHVFGTCEGTKQYTLPQETWILMSIAGITSWHD